MKTKRVINLVLIGIVFLLLTIAVWADEKDLDSSTTFTTGVFGEKNTERFDYMCSYSIFSVESKSDYFRIQYDHFFDNPSINNYQRLWINCEKFKPIISENFSIDFTPGIMIDNRDRIYYGGITNIDLPKWKLHITSRNYAGNKIDKHFTFATLGISKNIFLQHYYYMEKNWIPDSYLGPGLISGDFTWWIGGSTNRPGAWIVDLSVTRRF